MRNTRFRLLAGLAGIAATGLPGLSKAQAAEGRYPERSIRFLVPFAAGAGADALARILAQKLAAPGMLGQPVVVENRAGAGGSLAAQATAQSKPDGYTIFMGNVAPNAIDVSYRPSKTFNAARDLAPVTQLASGPLVLVCGANSPDKTLAAFIARAKADPSHYTFASAGNGSIAHLANTLFDANVGLKGTHVPYQGTAPAVPDVIAGRVSVLFSTTISVMSLIRSGQLRALAIADNVRSPLMPEVPTMEECGVHDFEVSTWYGIVVPRGTPAPVVDTLYTQIRKALADPEVQKQFDDIGARMVGSDPATFGAFMDREVKRWARAVELTKST